MKIESGKKALLRALIFLMCVPGIASAQDVAESAPEPVVDEVVEEVVEEPAPVADAPPAPEAPPATGDIGVGEVETEVDGLDRDDSMYWANLRDVYTVQKREFLKEGRFALSLYGGLIPNNIFEQYFPVGIRINYFILENIGLELASSYAFKRETRLDNLIRESGGVNAQQILIGDTQVSHSNFGIVWSPFYGKTAFYQSALKYFDLYLFAGAGIVVTETVPDFNAPPDTEVKPEGAIGGGLAYYVGRKHAAVRIDYRQFIFQKVAGVGGVANPSEVSLGFTWFF